MATPPGQEGHCRKALQKKKKEKKKQKKKQKTICPLVTIHMILVTLAEKGPLHRPTDRQTGTISFLVGRGWRRWSGKF